VSRVTHNGAQWLAGVTQQRLHLGNISMPDGFIALCLCGNMAALSPLTCDMRRFKIGHAL
jgi:hypothetical protein